MVRARVTVAYVLVLAAWVACVPRPVVPEVSPGVFYNSRASHPLTAKELSEVGARVCRAG